MAEERAERIVVGVPAARAYTAVSDLRRMSRWSPETFALLVWWRRGGKPARFLGFNRRGFYVWFTTCRVTVDRPEEEFAFAVTVFGLPSAVWGYRFAPAPATPDGSGSGTEVTEYWLDQRGRVARVIGRIFTGRVADNRPAANRDGMRATLERLKQDLEATPPAA